LARRRSIKVIVVKRALASTRRSGDHAFQRSAERDLGRAQAGCLLQSNLAAIDPSDCWA
jgi:hypothetical protein